MRSARPDTLHRLLWLDLYRGLAVLGMTFVNAAMYLHDVSGLAVPAAVRHAPWAGFTFADAVFPAFLLGIGMSVAARPDADAARAGVGKVAARTLRLILLGLIVSNLDLLQPDAEAHFRIMGVLQRLGLVYLACEAAVAALDARTRLRLALAILVVYGGLLLVPPPDMARDLSLPGHDLASWLDRVVLGPTLYVPGPAGFDPEGLLSTLPAIAQGLIGTLLTAHLERARTTGRWGGPLLLACGMVAAGVLVGAWQPIVKALWTPSFVLISTGAALALALGLGALSSIASVRSMLGAALLAVGRNAILAYVLQEVLIVLLTRPPLSWAAAAAPQSAAGAMGALAFTALVWALSWAAWRAGLRVRI
jgi:predicted acyltransferase